MYRREDCRDQVSLVERVMFSDYELIERFAENCKEDIIHYKCGRNDLPKDNSPQVFLSNLLYSLFYGLWRMAYVCPSNIFFYLCSSYFILCLTSLYLAHREKQSSVFRTLLRSWTVFVKLKFLE